MGANESFQFLGIPPKGERDPLWIPLFFGLGSFQFLGIPPKGEHTFGKIFATGQTLRFQFLGIPPKGERYTEGSGGEYGSPLVSNF